jgi:hypothetical protein
MTWFVFEAMWLDWGERPVELREIQAAELATARADGSRRAQVQAARPIRPWDLGPNRKGVEIDMPLVRELLPTNSIAVIARDLGYSAGTLRERIRPRSRKRG